MTRLSFPSVPAFSLYTPAVTLAEDMVVFSHLRWEFVTQRPQHIMNRIARYTNILFIEEPLPEAPQAETRVFSPAAGITVVQPGTLRMGDSYALAELVERVARDHDIVPGIAWFYSPAFVDVLAALSFDLVVYDCMDELTKFAGAHPELPEQERRLMEKADLVFTGGKSLYEVKSRNHPAVHCFPSSVDKAHFEQAANGHLPTPADMRKIQGPIVGYYGVIDERIDYDLLKTLAHRLPQLSFVMIGPVVKVPQSILPRAHNLHYLGQKDYAELPQYLAKFDAAMMPFADNEATRFISPTKTLEFLAAELPVISTPVTDVVRDYSRIVSIAATPEEFAFRLVDLLNEAQDERKKRQQLSRAAVSATSWDRTVQEMIGHMNDTLTLKKEVESVLPAALPELSFDFPAAMVGVKGGRAKAKK